MSEYRLADPAQRQRSDRDAELGGGDVAIDFLEGSLDDPCTTVALGDHLVEFAAASSHQGKLGGNEKPVDGDESEYCQYTARRHGDTWRVRGLRGN